MKRIFVVLTVSLLLLIGAACDTNKAPVTPGAPVGPGVGMAGDSLRFLVATTDPDSDSIRYRVDWGDALGDWTRFLASAESCTVVHAWSVTDTFRIEVLAEDAHGRQSEWSAGHLVSIESICRR